MDTQNKEIAANVAMAAPSLVNLFFEKVLGVTINEGLALLSMLFILAQLAYLGWKWYREWKGVNK